MRNARTMIGLAASLLAGLAAVPAEAGCTRSIINRSGLYAQVSRDGGPWVRIPPRAAQAIRLEHPGKLDIALTCGRGGLAPDNTVYRGALTYNAIIDRCYIEIDDGFVPDYFGGGTFGFRDTKPMTVNNPRQGDVIIGPRVDGACAVLERQKLRARY